MTTGRINQVDPTRLRALDSSEVYSVGGSLASKYGPDDPEVAFQKSAKVTNGLQGPL